MLLAVPGVAEACSCLFSSPCQTYASADAVFAGDVVQVADSSGSGPKIVQLRVAKTYKGSIADGDVVTVEMPGGSSASCSLDIAPGSRVVVYSGVKNGSYTTSLCRGSYALAEDQPWPLLPPPGGTVSGQLIRVTTDGRSAPQPVPAIPVWLEASGRRIAATTDADGAFRLTEVPAGSWTLRFDLGPSEVAEEQVTLRSVDDCAVVHVSPRRRAG
jgi:hypothetical protein